MNFVEVFKQLALNPLVLSSLLGISFQVMGITIPPLLEPTLRTLGASSLPIGLMCVGAALNFEGVRNWLKPVAVASVMRFIVMPVVTVGIGVILGLEDSSFTTALLFQVLPTASSSYIMARQLGGDAPLMAGIIAIQTVTAIFAIPLVIVVLSNAIAQ